MQRSETVVFGTNPGFLGEVVHLDLTAGSYVVMGNTNILDSSAASDSECDLLDTQTGFIDDNFATMSAASDNGVALSLLGTMTTTGPNTVTVSVRCSGDDANASALDTTIVAIKVDSIIGPGVL